MYLIFRTGGLKKDYKKLSNTDKDQEYKRKLATLRNALQEGKNSGVSTLSMNDILVKAKKKFDINV